jgi:hypothetical protein
LHGSGSWEANGSGNLGTFINGPQHTILANSSISAAQFFNEGTIRAGEGSPYSSSSFENSGLVDVPSGRSMSISSSITRVKNVGTLQIDGTLVVESPHGLYNFDGGLIDVQGQLTLDSTVPQGSTVLRNRAGGMLVGSGQIAPGLGSNPIVVNEGNIAPGPGVATLDIGVSFTQLSSGQLQVEIAGGESPTNDALAIDGFATLAGTLVAILVGEESLSLHDSFTLLTATYGIVGAFDQWVLPSLPDDQFWFIEYGANDVRATVEEKMAGDFNLDGTVDAADYVAWVKTGGDMPEYGIWQTNFGSSVAGESSSTSAGVPEPTSAQLLMVLIACAASLRVRSAHRKTA